MVALGDVAPCITGLSGEWARRKGAVMADEGDFLSPCTQCYHAPTPPGRNQRLGRSTYDTGRVRGTGYYPTVTIG